MRRYSRTLAQGGLLLLVTLAFLRLPAQVKALADNLPLIALWPDAEAQQRRQLSQVPYDLLQQANRLLSPDATVLLVTSGRDSRYLEYITFHRALYFLIPRPVWWLSPAPADGSWESRWWISAPLTVEAIAATASDLGAACILAVEANIPEAIGQPLVSRDDGALWQVAGAEGDCTWPGASHALLPAQLPVTWPLRLLVALGIVFLWGYLLLAVVERLGYQATGVEGAALAWVLGAGVLTVAMLWLNGLGVSLLQQRLLLTVPAAALFLWLAWSWRRGAETDRQSPGVASLVRSPLSMLLLALLVFQIGFVALMAVGRPLDAWDSWVNWGMKARTIFLEGLISPAVYADPSRAVTLQDYPLFIPLLEAWLFAWLGTPDDRLVGIIAVLFYVALAAILYSALRRRAASPVAALAVSSGALAVPHLSSLSAAVYPDAVLAVLSAIAAIYLLGWLSSGNRGELALAAIAAGLLPWTKREGLILLIALCLATLLVSLWLASVRGRGHMRRATVGVAVLLFGVALLAGPWWAFSAWRGVTNDAFLPMTPTVFWANVERLPVVAGLVLENLLSARFHFVWPLAAVLVLVGWRESVFRRATAGALLLLTPLLYLGLVSLTYVFSDFVPYQQHVISSFYRLAAHVLALPLIWIAYRALPDPHPP